MRRNTLLVIFFLLSTITTAVEQDSTLNKWEPKLFSELNLSQIAFSNWAKGGESSFSFTLKFNWEMQYKSSNNWIFSNKFFAEAGRTKINPGILKTTANEMFNVTILKFNISNRYESPFVSFLIRTPITNGYDYKATPAKVISGFFDPGYLTQTMGVFYSRSKVFKTRMGFAFEESFANKFAQRYTDNSETSEIEYFKFETGIESVSNLTLLLDKDIKYKGTLRLFSGFDRLTVWDVIWNNSITAKFNDWFNVNFQFLLVYSTKESLNTQMQESIQIGFVYDFL